MTFYTQVNAIASQYFVPKLYDNIFDSNPLLQRAKKKGWYEKIDGGTSIMVPLEYAQTTSSGWYSASDILLTQDNNNISAAEYQWKQAYANITITRKEELMNKGSKTQIVDLVKAKMKIAEKTLADKLGAGLYSDGSTDANSIVGLEAIISTSSTIGGISQTTYSWWAAQVSTSTTLTMTGMQELWNLCTVDNEQPTVIMTTRANYNRYYALLQPQQRFQDSETAKGGFSSIMFNGAPVITDSHVDTGDMTFINENHLSLKVHKDEDMRYEPMTAPINQNVKSGKIYWMGALCSSNNRLHGGFTSLTA